MGAFYLLPNWEQYILPMHVLSRGTLRDFWVRDYQAERPLRAWLKLVAAANWNNFAELKATFGSADAVGDSRAIFDIGGNKYRIVARIAYGPYYRVMIKFVGTHRQYDAINPETV